MVNIEGTNIDVDDYNALVASVNALYAVGTGDSGYGGTSSTVLLAELPDVPASNKITQQDLFNIRDAISDLAIHQGTILTDALPETAIGLKPVFTGIKNVYVGAYADPNGPEGRQMSLKWSSSKPLPFQVNGYVAWLKSGMG